MSNRTFLGKVGMVPKGEWDSSITYERLDVVSYQGSSFIAKAQNTNSMPTESNPNWMIAAKHGEFTEEQLEEFKEEVVRESKQDIDDYTDDKKSELDSYEESKETELNNYTAGKKEELDTHTTGKITDFNTNATNKTNTFNQNAEDKTTAFNQNASSKTNDFNDNATSKTTTFNSNASDKTETFNTNASSKTTDFNDNATSKTSDFDDNAESKTTDFNTNAQEKTDDFDEHTQEFQIRLIELEEENRRLRKASYKLPGSGENITLDKTAEMEFVVPPLPRGNTSQNTTLGVQLLDKDTVTVINGYIVSNSNVIGDNGASNKILYITIQPNTTYTVSKNNFSLDAFGIASTVNIPAKDVQITQKAVDKFANSLTITTGANDNYLAVYCKGQSLIFPEIFYDIDLQIEEGAVASDYEVFTNGQASPTPNYPQNINVVKGSTNVAIINKNIIKVDFINPPATIAGLNYSYTDNTLKLNGTAAGSWQNLTFKNNIWFEYGKKYCFSAKVTGTNPNMQLSLIAYSSSGQALTHSAINKSNNYRNIIEFYVKEKVDHYTLSVVVTNGGEYDLTAEIMLEPSAAPTDFVEHKEQVLPLDLPVENLMALTNSTNTDGGITRVIENGVIKLNGTPQSTSYNNTIFTFTARKTGQYMLLPYKSSTNSNIRFIYKINDGSFINNDDNLTMNLTKNDVVTINLRISSTDIINNFTLKPMLYLGTKVNAFYPYGTTPIELCKIGDYQDYFYKDNGKWYLHKETKKVIFDGSEDWMLREDDGTNYCYSIRNVTDYKHGTLDSYGFSNYFDVGIGIGYHDALLRGIGLRFYSLDSDNMIYLVTNNVTTVNNLKDWLTSNNVTLYYVLETPTNTEITVTTLINQLEAINNAISYYEQTNISGISGGANPLFDVTAVADMNLLLDPIEARLTLVES